MSRTLVIGDIHGALKALEQVLGKAQVTTEDTLVFLGDYMDGWSDAAPTLDFLIELNSSHSCVFLRGNHDELCLEWLMDGEENTMWLHHGGQTTVDSYAEASNEQKKLHMQFLMGLDNFHLDKKNRLFLHAGFTNMHGVLHEYFPKVFYWDRTLWEMALLVEEIGIKKVQRSRANPQRLKHYHEIYIGHTPVTRIGKTTPVKAANVWNIDTGAAFKGPLSIMDVDSKEVWQSDPAYTFYPNEDGRN